MAYDSIWKPRTCSALLIVRRTRTSRVKGGAKIVSVHGSDIEVLGTFTGSTGECTCKVSVWRFEEVRGAAYACACVFVRGGLVLRGGRGRGQGSRRAVEGGRFDPHTVGWT